MIKYIGMGILFASMLMAQSSSTEVAISTPPVTASSGIIGSYSPLSIDSGIVLSLAADQSFSARWWTQDSRSGKILGDIVSGKWKEDGNAVRLYFDTNNRKGLVCKFRPEEVGSKFALILDDQSEFPFNRFFGIAYYKITKKANDRPKQ
jgi:hypothetical protein